MERCRKVFTTLTWGPALKVPHSSWTSTTCTTSTRWFKLIARNYVHRECRMQFVRWATTQRLISPLQYSPPYGTAGYSDRNRVCGWACHQLPVPISGGPGSFFPVRHGKVQFFPNTANSLWEVVRFELETEKPCSTVVAIC